MQSTSLIATPEPVPGYVVTSAAVTRAPAGSPQRAFLRHWRSLQQRDWSAAANRFESGLGAFIGAGLLTRALQTLAPTYRAGRPKLVSTMVDGDEAIIRYRRVSAEPPLRATITWTRDPGGAWLISHDDLLDQGLAQARERETQLAIDPLAQRLVPEAIAAGNSARGLQQEYAARTRNQRPMAP